jgi:hypothetical protein
MPTDSKPTTRWFRFSLATFLFACLCISGLMAGYQSGFRAGYHKGQETRYDQTQISELYSTSAVIWPDLPGDEWAKSAAELKDLIRSTISSEVWGTGSGNVIYQYPSSQSLMIVAPGSAHREIKELFAQLESLGSRNGAEQLLPALQALAAQGKTQDTPLQIAAPKNSLLARAWLEKYFRLTVDGISQRWGRPEFRGACTDAEFPAWSLDQQIATWPRGNGQVYLALRYLDDGELHLVAGWRESS